MLDRLIQDFSITDITERHAGLTTCKVEKNNAERLIRELRDREGYTHLSFIACVDYLERGVFSIIYMLHSYAKKDSLGIHVEIDRDNAEMTSIHTLWAQAWTYQRELREMYGIKFPGSPRLEEDFCLEGWDSMPPMRRDFDTAQYSTEHFGHREGRVSEEPREHMKVNLYPNRGGDEK
jgi:NADH-quinone oxidoreductase subunit C